jgi:hypothetical protein
MLTSFSPYVPQGLMPQSAGVQGVGVPPMSPAPFSQPLFGINSPFSYAAQPAYGFGVQPNPYLQSPFTPNQFLQNPFLAGTNAHNPLVNSGSAGYGLGHIAAQQIVPVLAQLAQQISIQSAVTQQLGLTLHQIAQQVAAQTLQSQPGAGLGAGQMFAGAGPFNGGNPFASATQGSYGGFNPQVQAWWGGNRPQTIQ